MAQIMRILGFDPGLARVGYGVIDSDGHRHKAVNFGTISTHKSETTPVRLAHIFDAATQLINEYKPDAVAIEELFFSKNVTNAISVAEARGVLLAVSVRSVGKLYEYTPMQIKQAMTGYGKADKKQITEMVKRYLGLVEAPKLDDTSDALAVALTHIFTGAFREKFEIK